MYVRCVQENETNEANEDVEDVDDDAQGQDTSVASKGKWKSDEIKATKQPVATGLQLRTKSMRNVK